jgi:hypothetical protein
MISCGQEYLAGLRQAARVTIQENRIFLDSPARELEINLIEEN